MIETAVKQNLNIHQNDDCGSTLYRSALELRAPDELETDPVCGLSEEEVERRRRVYGLNQVRSQETPGLATIILHQFQSSVIYLLGMATVISLALHEFLQAAGIMVVVVINAAIGIALEYKANISLAHLMTLSGALARVRRSNRELSVPTIELVPGDIVKLSSGQRVPADLRVLECASLSVDESALSGESTPVYKEQQSGDEQSKTAILFQGTLVLSGRALAVVTATGADSSLGRMGKALTDVATGITPLEQQLGRLGDVLTKMTIWVCAIVGTIGLLLHQPFFTMFQTSVTLAVAAIPEALPLIATLAMAVGIQKMNQSRALIRRLPAVETLGCTSVICTDKTGTLTENKMILTSIVMDEHHLTLSGSGYNPEGKLEENAAPVSPAVLLDAKALLSAAALCNDAKLENEVDEGGWHIHGDPTEGALLTAAEKIGMHCQDLKDSYPRIREFPFDLQRRRMSTLHYCKTADSAQHLFVKGAPEVVLMLCTEVLSNGQARSMTDETRQHFIAENQRLASAGLRVLAIASRVLPKQLLPEQEYEVESDTDTRYDADSLESNLTLLGLVGLADRPKDGVQEAIAQCHQAGVRVVMLTGDQVQTASAIGAELGIMNALQAGQALDATALPETDDGNVNNLLENARVFARTSPESKLRIVQLLQRSGEVVAMTGDGVNDAPALKQADIGIAMGATGTEMAREAASLVITDDNFATIVKAIEHGRITYDNIKRCVAYLLTASLTSVMVVTLGIFTGSGLMLKPLQLLSLNLIMHVFPALGIVVQTYDRGLMRMQPRARNLDIVGKEQMVQIVLRSTIISVVVLACVLAGMFSSGHATTAVLFAVSISLVSQSWLWLAKPVETKRLFNWAMAICTLLALGTLAGSIYWPPLALVLETTPLTSSELRTTFIMLVVTLLMTVAVSNVQKKPAIEVSR